MGHEPRHVPDFAAVVRPGHDNESRVLAQLEQLMPRNPRDARGWYDLGCACNLQGRYDEALRALHWADTLTPYNPTIEGELAYALSGTGNLDRAAGMFENILNRDAGNAWAYFHLGSIRFHQDRLDEAIVFWECAARLQEDPRDTLENLAIAYRRAGQKDSEKDCWQRLGEVDAAHPVARHMLAALGQGRQPERAGDSYLNHLFDRFANDFDGVLGALDYRVPQLLEERLQAMQGEPAADLEALDAGCGTGLCGERVRPWARRLTGVDISSGMQDKARQRNIYDELLTGELTDYLVHCKERYDWIIAGDVLCYFGNLKPFIQAAADCLVSGGRLFLTLEQEPLQAIETPGYRLQIHGRYCHTRVYLETVVQASGLLVESLDGETLRHESGEPVAGLCAVLCRP